MNKLLFIVILLLSQFYIFSQSITIPPELNWWLQEIQKEDETININNFIFNEERIIEKEKKPVSYKNKLYSVLKKWNYYGNTFAYYSVFWNLKKEKNGKYTILADSDSQFGIFDKKENLLFMDYFGSSKWIDSFCWLNDNRIIAVGEYIWNENNEKNVDFIIYDYSINNDKINVKEYICTEKDFNFEKLKLSWFEQRSDCFEVE